MAESDNSEESNNKKFCDFMHQTGCKYYEAVGYMTAAGYDLEKAFSLYRNSGQNPTDTRSINQETMTSKLSLVRMKPMSPGGSELSDQRTQQETAKLETPKSFPPDPSEPDLRQELAQSAQKVKSETAPNWSKFEPNRKSEIEQETVQSVQKEMNKSEIAAKFRPIRMEPISPKIHQNGASSQQGAQQETVKSETARNLFPPTPVSDIKVEEIVQSGQEEKTAHASAEHSDSESENEYEVLKKEVVGIIRRHEGERGYRLMYTRLNHCWKNPLAADVRTVFGKRYTVKLKKDKSANHYELWIDNRYGIAFKPGRCDNDKCTMCYDVESDTD